MASRTKRKHAFNPSELYDLCRSSIEQPHKDEAEKVFDKIHEWLNNNKYENSRLKAAITYQGDHDDGPTLHFILNYGFPLDIIDVLVKLVPESVQIKDQDGRLPIHCACLHKGSWFFCGLDFHLQVLNLLIDAYPEGVDQKTNSGKTPLDYLKDTKYAETSDGENMIPLHHACKNGYSEHLIRLLIQAYPQSINIKDTIHRKTPYIYYTNPYFHHSSVKGWKPCNEIRELLRPTKTRKNNHVNAPASTPQNAEDNTVQVLPPNDNEIVPFVTSMPNESLPSGISENNR